MFQRRVLHRLQGARRFAVKLTEIFKVVDREIVTGKMQQRILQHGSVTVGKKESIAAEPVRISGIVSEMFCPEATAMSAIPIGMPG